MPGGLVPMETVKVATKYPSFLPISPILFRNIVWPSQDRARCDADVQQLHVRVPAGVQLPPGSRAGQLAPGVRPRGRLVTRARQVLPSAVRRQPGTYHYQYFYIPLYSIYTLIYIFYTYPRFFKYIIKVPLDCRCHESP